MDSITLERIKLMHPDLREELLKDYTHANNKLLPKGVRLRFAHTYRTNAEQDTLYAQKPKVTNAKGGQSIHNYGCAFDIVILFDKDGVGKQFMNCIHLALIKQKQEMSRRMLGEDDKNWTRFAWVMERKFQEWNLKHISENINRNEQQTTIQITAANDEQRQLIDNIINIDFEEIKPKELDESNDNESEEYEF